MPLRVVFIILLSLTAPNFAQAMRCKTYSMEDFAGLPNTSSQMMVLGRVDENYLFQGVILGPTRSDQPVQFPAYPRLEAGQLTSKRFLEGRMPILPTKRLILGPVIKRQDGQYHFIGHSCDDLLIWKEPTPKQIKFIRQCQRRKGC